MDFAIVEIQGRQYKIKPDHLVEVDSLGDKKKLTLEKVLVLSEKGEIKVGKPYLDLKLEVEVVNTYKKPKVRVATYKAKANNRRVKGQRREVSVIKLV